MTINEWETNAGKAEQAMRKCKQTEANVNTRGTNVCVCVCAFAEVCRKNPSSCEKIEFGLRYTLISHLFRIYFISFFFQRILYVCTVHVRAIGSECIYNFIVNVMVPEVKLCVRARICVYLLMMRWSRDPYHGMNAAKNVSSQHPGKLKAYIVNGMGTHWKHDPGDDCDGNVDDECDGKHTLNENILQNKINYLWKQKLWSPRAKTHIA